MISLIYINYLTIIGYLIWGDEYIIMIGLLLVFISLILIQKKQILEINVKKIEKLYNKFKGLTFVKLLKEEIILNYEEKLFLINSFSRIKKLLLINLVKKIIENKKIKIISLILFLFLNKIWINIEIDKILFEKIFYKWEIILKKIIIINNKKYVS